MTSEPGRLPVGDTPVFETFFRVRFHEVDALGHVNNAAYLNYLEQAAIDHAASAGLDLERLRGFGGVFVARKHEIVFLRPTFAGDLLRVLTWLDAPRGARIVRNSIIARETTDAGTDALKGRRVDARNLRSPDEPVVRAATEWVFVADSGQPRRIPPAVIDQFHTQGTYREPRSRTS